MSNNRMKQQNILKRVFGIAEFINILIGTSLTLVEFFWIKDNGFGVISIFFTASSGLALSSIRYLITKDKTEEKKKFKDIENSFNNVPSRWRSLAEKDLDACKHQIESYNKKEFSIEEKDCLYSHQVRLISGVKDSLKAVHLGEDYEKLKFWDPNQKGKFHTTSIINANNKIRKGANKQRIFILNRDLFEHNIEYKELLKSVVKNQKDYLKFRVKIIFSEDVKNEKKQIPYDFQIADEDEVISVIFKGSDHPSGQATIDEQEVRKKIEEFEELWNNAKTPEALGLLEKRKKNKRKRNN